MKTACSINALFDIFVILDLLCPNYGNVVKECMEPGESRHFSSYHFSEERRNLETLYKEALREGGFLLVYAGGDTPDQQNFVKESFEKRFPKMRVEIIVDFSKNHGPRIDYQVETGTLIPDVAHLQTLQDFPRWKAKGLLLPYKARGWGQVYDEFKDPEGHWVGISVIAFSNLVNSNLLEALNILIPREAGDYLNPELRGKIISTFPNDDDAVLFWYKLVIEKYGWKWIQDFLQNQPRFVRGTQAPYDLVENGTFLATFTTAGSLKGGKGPLFLLPETDPFVSWAQRAAIFRGTKRPNAAKLYLNWWLDFETQRDVVEMWSVRNDVPVPSGFRSIFNYTGQTDVKGFEKFMEDREEVERFKGKVTLFVGEPKGPSPPCDLGTHPKEMIQNAC